MSATGRPSGGCVSETSRLVASQQQLLARTKRTVARVPVTNTLARTSINQQLVATCYTATQPYFPSWMSIAA